MIGIYDVLTQWYCCWSFPLHDGRWKDHRLPKAPMQYRCTDHLKRIHRRIAIERKVELLYKSSEELTAKGWSSLLKITFSFSIWSTCLLEIISCFFIDLIAYFLLGSLLNQPTFTKPNAPMANSQNDLTGEKLTFTECITKNYIIWIHSIEYCSWLSRLNHVRFIDYYMICF